MRSIRHNHSCVLFLACLSITSCGSETERRVTLRASIEIPVDKASTLTIADNGDTVAVTGYDRNIVLVVPETGDVAAVMNDAHVRRVRNAEFRDRLYTSSIDTINSWQRPDGRLAVSINAGGKIVRTEVHGVVASGSNLSKGPFVAERADGSIDYFAVTPEEDYVLAVVEKRGRRSMTTWRLDNGNAVASVADVEKAVLSSSGMTAALSDKKRMGRTDMGTSVKFHYHRTTTLYSVPYLRKKKTLSGVWAIAFSPDESALLARNNKDQVILHSIDAGVATVLPFEHEVKYSRFSGDGKFLLLSNGSVVACFDSASGERLWQQAVGTDEAGDVIQVTPDNALAVFKADGAAAPIRLVDIRTGEDYAAISGESIFTGFALSPDGRTLATAMYRNRLALWDVH